MRFALCQKMPLIHPHCSVDLTVSLLLEQRTSDEIASFKRPQTTQLQPEVMASILDQAGMSDVGWFHVGRLSVRCIEKLPLTTFTHQITSAPMKVIELDGSEWSDSLDFFDALAKALGACSGHGRSFDAFEDSVFYGGMLDIEPPFKVVVRNCPAFAREDIETMACGWAEQREWKKANYGDDVEATIALEE